jgi:hypothetical protein
MILRNGKFSGKFSVRENFPPHITTYDKNVAKQELQEQRREEMKDRKRRHKRGKRKNEYIQKGRKKKEGRVWRVTIISDHTYVPFDLTELGANLDNLGKLFTPWMGDQPDVKYLPYTNRTQPSVESGGGALGHLAHPGDATLLKLYL